MIIVRRNNRKNIISIFTPAMRSTTAIEWMHKFLGNSKKGNEQFLVHIVRDTIIISRFLVHMCKFLVAFKCSSTERSF